MRVWVGNYVSGPPPASFFTESEISEIHGEYARIRFLKKLDFRNRYWVQTCCLRSVTLCLLSVKTCKKRAYCIVQIDIL